MKTWEKLLAKDWVGCDLEVQEAVIYRGQIKNIEQITDCLQVVMKWCAMLRPDGKWHYKPAGHPLGNGYFSFPSLHTIVSDIGQGRMLVTMSLGLATFFPREVSRLDPSKVHGLPRGFQEPDFVDPKD